MDCGGQATPTKAGAVKGQFWCNPESLQHEGPRTFSLVARGAESGRSAAWSLLTRRLVARHQVQKNTLLGEEVTE